MKDTDGNDITKGDTVLVYRPGVTETATVDLPDPRLALTTPIFFLRYGDGFSALHDCAKDGRPRIPADWRIVKV